MNFTDFILDQQSRLCSQDYVDVLWQRVKGDNALVLVEPSVKTEYLDHLPLDFTNFMKNCIAKLREMKFESNEIDWTLLNRKYLSTLVFQVTIYKEPTLSIYLLCNSLTSSLRTASVIFIPKPISH